MSTTYFKIKVQHIYVLTCCVCAGEEVKFFPYKVLSD